MTASGLDNNPPGLLNLLVGEGEEIDPCRQLIQIENPMGAMVRRNNEFSSHGVLPFYAAGKSGVQLLGGGIGP